MFSLVDDFVDVMDFVVVVEHSIKRLLFPQKKLVGLLLNYIPWEKVICEILSLRFGVERLISPFCKGGSAAKILPLANKVLGRLNPGGGSISGCTRFVLLIRLNFT